MIPPTIAMKVFDSVERARQLIPGKQRGTSRRSIISGMVLPLMLAAKTALSSENLSRQQNPHA
jgi:hypothetical protein